LGELDHVIVSKSPDLHIFGDLLAYRIVNSKIALEAIVRMPSDPGICIASSYEVPLFGRTLKVNRQGSMVIGIRIRIVQAL